HSFYRYYPAEWILYLTYSQLIEEGFYLRGKLIVAVFPCHNIILVNKFTHIRNNRCCSRAEYFLEFAGIVRLNDFSYVDRSFFYSYSTVLQVFYNGLSGNTFQNRPTCRRRDNFISKHKENIHGPHFLNIEVFLSI